MIMLRRNTVMILRRDGSKTAFDANDLESKLIQSFLATGHREPWVAEDLTLSIEFILNERKVEDPVYTEEEVNGIVVKVLEDTGFPEVASCFQRQNAIPKTKTELDTGTVADLIQKHMDLSPEQIWNLAQKVVSACKTLNIESPSHYLLVELGRTFFEERAEIPSSTSSNSFGVGVPGKGDVWLVRAEDVLDQLEESEVDYFEVGVLSIGHVSRLFPALKIDLNLSNFCHLVDLEPPLTELSLYPRLMPLGLAIDNVHELVSESTGIERVDLPVYLKVVDSFLFIQNYLMMESDDPETALDDVLFYLQEMTVCDFRKITFC